MAEEFDKIQRVRALKIYEMLCQDSDEDNPLSTSAIIAKLAHDGIECNRKTLYKDIKALNDFGFEVLSRREQSNVYYVVSRQFDVPELRILIDAVQAASFITPGKSRELIDKIAGLGGSNRGKVLKNSTAFNTVKMKNEGIYYNVASLDEAIIAKHQASFQYFDYNELGKRILRKEGERYIVNPIALVFNENNYYLVCYNDKYQNISNYRVDRMTDVRVEGTKITKAECAEHFSFSEYRKQAFSMFAGKPIKVQIQFDQSLTDVIIDRFGDDVSMRRVGVSAMCVSVSVIPSQMFFGWCSSFGDKLRLMAPADTVQKYAEYIKSIANSY
ncbi:transcriptional regulator [bacterium]|nr:transcriptional regulator [bacterium]